MPVIPLYRGQRVLRGKSIPLAPREDEESDSWIFLIVLIGIVGFAMLSALVGLIWAKCCSKRGDQKLVEKIAAEVAGTQRIQVVSASASARSSRTFIANPVVERRRANMLALNAFVGWEERIYADKKRSRRSRGRKSSSIMLPVTLASLRKWAKRSTLSGDQDELRQPSNHASPTLSSNSELWPIPTSIPTHPSPLHCKSKCTFNTSTDYDEPSRLLEDIRPCAKQTLTA
ncbi:uncharacterized protein A1O5_07090 [Cladophialophora psammophila CBS 110553]|uniref:Uncharacterized protein n=1 Tax=Cladophialophora psammophila CBS 110553 TaxID=1182543 RepID=W9WPB2_9EURO|nr:uncharacterized protein A1O5_07090 [Cladophialophora psammophila CBS 110553]EXJ70017.1 hypothetical protein A1O5_07090 [Cladophialophora psammophila CBS 110553]